MARTKGTNISLTYEPGLRRPFDSRQLVTTKSDLTIASTWVPNGSSMSNAFNGMIVAVSSDAIAENNGVYYLADRNNLTSESAWIKLAELREVLEIQSKVDALADSISGDLLQAINAQLESLSQALENLEISIESKQDKLESGVNIKTLNGESILGEGNISIQMPEQNVVELASHFELPNVGNRHTYYKCLDEGTTYVYDDETSTYKVVGIFTALAGVDFIDGGDATAF